MSVVSTRNQARGSDCGKSVKTALGSLEGRRNAIATAGTCDGQLTTQRNCASDASVKLNEFKA